MAQQRLLVVGGGQGIGAAVTQNLVEKYGAKVVVLSLQVDPAIEQLGQLDKIRLIQGDATSSTVLGETFDAVETYLGGLDALVITMGVLGEIETVANLDMNKFRQAYEINLFTPIAITQKALPYLQTSRGRAVILSSAADSTVTYSGWSPYCSSKAALSRFIYLLHHEEEDIDVVGVYPGLTRTPMVTDLVTGKFAGKMKDSEVEAFKRMDRDGQVEPLEWSANVTAKLAVAAIETGPLSGQVNWYHEIDSHYQTA
ncbi:NAD(P)-binding protein [Sarocladium strictum]